MPVQPGSANGKSNKPKRFIGLTLIPFLHTEKYTFKITREFELLLRQEYYRNQDGSVETSRDDVLWYKRVDYAKLGFRRHKENRVGTHRMKDGRKYVLYELRDTLSGRLAGYKIVSVKRGDWLKEEEYGIPMYFIQKGSR